MSNMNKMTMSKEKTYIMEHHQLIMIKTNCSIRQREAKMMRMRASYKTTSRMNSSNRTKWTNRRKMLTKTIKTLPKMKMINT